MRSMPAAPDPSAYTIVCEAPSPTVPGADPFSLDSRHGWIPSSAWWDAWVRAITEAQTTHGWPLHSRPNGHLILSAVGVDACGILAALVTIEHRLLDDLHRVTATHVTSRAPHRSEVPHVRLELWWPD